jgi:IS5 family transposase
MARKNTFGPTRAIGEHRAAWTARSNGTLPRGLATSPRCQFGLVKVRFRGLAKNSAHIVTLFALSKLWMVRKQLMAMAGVVRPKPA